MRLTAQVHKPAYLRALGVDPASLAYHGLCSIDIIDDEGSWMFAAEPHLGMFPASCLSIARLAPLDTLLERGTLVRSDDGRHATDMINGGNWDIVGGTTGGLFQRPGKDRWVAVESGDEEGGVRITQTGTSKRYRGVFDRFYAVDAGAILKVSRETKHAIMARLASASTAEALDLVTVGFELETQATNGWSWGSRATATTKAEAAEALATLINSRLRGTAAEGALALDDIGEYLASHVDPSKLSTLDLGMRAEEALTKQLKGLNIKQDSSVAGFEFTTLDGGLSPVAAAEAAEQLFRLKHTVDVGCSFHIHVQVKGLRHKYAPTIQAACTEFLLRNIDRVPTSVRARWRSAKRESYFCPKIEQTKMTFVNGHAQGTWEFRCFGNIATADDAYQCIQLAVEALQYAYQVLLGLASTPLLYGTVTNTQWRTSMSEACALSTPPEAPKAPVIDLESLDEVA